MILARSLVTSSSLRVRSVLRKVEALDSIYGKLRKEPRREALSTLESVADALVANGEPEATRAEMRKVFRTMVQRARDYYASKGITEVPPEVSDGTDEGTGEE
jgi:DTW domain-containing protein YfiP